MSTFILICLWMGALLNLPSERNPKRDQKLGLSGILFALGCGMLTFILLSPTLTN